MTIGTDPEQLKGFVNTCVGEYLERYLFEPNDEETWSHITYGITDFFKELYAHKTITGFSVCCDQTNNPPQAVDKNILRVDVRFQPSVSTEYIWLKFVLQPEEFEMSNTSNYERAMKVVEHY